MQRSFILIVLALSLISVLVSCKKDNEKPPFTVDDLPAEANAENGANLFDKGDGGAAACSTCHSTDGEDRATAPTLQGIASRADDRVDGENAREYLLNSIIAPGRHIVGGYSNTMPSSYADKLSKQAIADLIAYLLTLS